MANDQTVFKNSQLHEVDFAECDLSSAVFDDCDVTGAIFKDTTLEKADFRTAINYLIDPEHIFGTWLPNSDYILDDRAHFEIMGTFFSYFGRN